MLTVWTIGNFKSIREPITLDLAPLTVFSGINSSGKSTLIQSILMVAQSFMSVIDDEALVLNGRFLQLGHLEDILHYGYEDTPITIGFDFLPTDELINPESLVIHVDAHIKQGLARKSQGKSGRKATPYVENLRLVFDFIHRHRDANNKAHMNVLEIQSNKATDLPQINRLPADLRSQIENGDFDYQITKSFPAQLNQDNRIERVQRVSLSNIIPSRLLVSIDTELGQLIQDTEWIINLLAIAADSTRSNPRDVKDTYLAPQLSVLFKYIKAPQTSIKQFERKQEDSIWQFRHTIIANPGKMSRLWVLRQLTSRIYSPQEMIIFRDRLVAALTEYLHDNPPKPIGKAETTYEKRLFSAEFMLPLNEIQSLFRDKIYYLGPLREAPSVIYAHPPISGKWNVGIKGEFTAAMLDEYRNMWVSYPVPPEKEFSGYYPSRRGPLIEAVTIWLQRMGLVDAVDTKETSKVGYHLTVNSPGLKKSLDLTSVGVGISQILPTLVMALMAPIDSILIFEQPELHLHPKVQSVLGDFFLAMSLMGKQCLVETHSEHLINRLRRRIVESDQDTVLPKLRIYFAEKRETVSYFQQVKPNEFGTILEWPKGFFDEAENEASLILKLQMEKRREARARQKQQKQGGA